MIAPSQSEKAQILVLFVFGLIGLLGFAALAIDGSLVYSDRRFDQSVADAAVLAGAATATQYMNSHGVRYENFDCPFPQVTLAAINGSKQRVLDNNMAPLADGLSSGHGVLVECISVNLGGHLDRYLKITVNISSITKTSFAHIATGHDNIRNTVTAQVQVRPPTNVAYGYAMASLGTTCTDSHAGGGSDGIEFAGTADTTIHNSGIFSNSCLRGNGNVNIEALPTYETGVYSHVAPALIGGAHILPAPNQTPDLLPRMPFPPPDCSQVPSRGSFSQNSGVHTILPGRYTKIDIGSNAVVTLSRGLYCITGTSNNDGFLVSGTVWGEQVEIYLQDGEFDSGGGTSVHLTAPINWDYPPAQKGMLIFMRDGNNDGIDMRGGSNALFAGTIYAPSTTVNAGGNASSVGAPQYSTQFIANHILLHGTPGLEIWYDDSIMAEFPTSLNLTQ